MKFGQLLELRRQLGPDGMREYYLRCAYPFAHEAHLDGRDTSGSCRARGKVAR